LIDPKIKPTYPCNKNADGIPTTVIKYPNLSSSLADFSSVSLIPNVIIL